MEQRLKAILSTGDDPQSLAHKAVYSEPGWEENGYSLDGSCQVINI